MSKIKLLYIYAVAIILFSGCTTIQVCEEQPVVKRTYYPSGKLQWESTYKCGRLNGISKLFRETGELWKEENYLNGKKHGPEKEYFDGTSTLYKAGQWEETKYENGKKQQTIRYRNNGDWDSIVNYKNGELQNYTKLQEGNAYPETKWEHKGGKLVGLTIYFPGSLGIYQDCSYRGALEKVHTCKEYYENGVLRYSDKYNNGEKISRKAYDEEGKLKFEQKY